MLLEELAKSPDKAWDQLKVLIWRFDWKSDDRLLVRLQEAAPQAGLANERAFLNLRYMEARRLRRYGQWSPNATQAYLIQADSTLVHPNFSTASFETFSKIHH